MTVLMLHGLSKIYKMLKYFEKKITLEGISCFNKSVDSNYLYLMKIYYASGSQYVNSIFHSFCATILWSRYYLCPHCIDEETEVQTN